MKFRVGVIYLFIIVNTKCVILQIIITQITKEQK